MKHVLKHRQSEKRTSRFMHFPDGELRLIALPQWAWSQYDKLIHELPDDPMHLAYNAQVGCWRHHVQHSVTYEEFLRELILDAIVRFSAANDDDIDSN